MKAWVLGEGYVVSRNWQWLAGGRYLSRYALTERDAKLLYLLGLETKSRHEP